MEKIIALLKPRIDQINQLVSNAEKYFSLIKDTVISSDPLHAQKFAEHISKIRADIATIQGLFDQLSVKPNATELVKIFYTLYDDLESIYGSIDFLLSIIENPTYTKYILINMSQTFTAGLQQQKNQIVISRERIATQVIEDDINIFNELIDQIDLSSVIDLVIELALGHVNKLIIHLIDNIIDIISQDKALATKYSKIYAIIEDLKDKTLEAKRIDFTEYHPLMRFLPRYELTAVNQSRPLADIFADIGKKYSKNLSPEENIKALAESTSLKTGAIIIYNITSSPIEFNILPLVSTDYVAKHDLLTSPSAGINKKSLERLRTVRQLSRPEQIMPGFNRYTSPNTSAVYIFETLNGNDFRILSNSAEYTVKTEDIPGLIHGLSLRPNAYNNFINAEILSKCFDSKADLVMHDYEREKRSLPSSTVIKEAIKSDLVDEFRGIVSAANVSSITQFKNLAIGPPDNNYISKVLSDKLTHNYGVVGRGGIEYTLTYVTKLDQIIRLFTRELNKNITQIRIPTLTFKERSKDDLANYLVEAYTSAVKAAIETLDREPSMWVDYDFSLKEYYLTSKYIIA